MSCLSDLDLALSVPDRADLVSFEEVSRHRKETRADLVSVEEVSRHRRETRADPEVLVLTTRWNAPGRSRLLGAVKVYHWGSSPSG